MQHTDAIVHMNSREKENSSAIIVKTKWNGVSWPDLSGALLLHLQARRLAVR